MARSERPEGEQRARDRTAPPEGTAPPAGASGAAPEAPDALPGGEAVPPDLELFRAGELDGTGLLDDPAYGAVELVRGVDHDLDAYLDGPAGEAWRALLADVTFVARERGGALIGYWRYRRDKALSECPVVVLDPDGTWRTTAPSLAEHFVRAADEARRPAAVTAMMAWLEERGLPRPADPDDIRSAARGLPPVEPRLAKLLASAGEGEEGGALPVVTEHTATALEDGRVLVVGGRAEDDRALAGVTWEGAAGWKAQTTVEGGGADRRTPRARHRAVRLADGRVLVVGGRDRPRTSELWDPAEAVWRRAGRLGTPRASGAALVALAAGRALVVGGSDGEGTSDACEVFDPAAGAWSPAGSLLDKRGAPTATLLPDGRVLIAGGRGAHRAVRSTELWDPKTGDCSEGPPMGAARCGHTATALPDGRVLIAGGEEPDGEGGSAGGRAPGTAEVFDPGAGRFSPPTPLPRARVAHAAALLADGRVALIGGDGFTRAVDVLDPVEGACVAAGGLLLGRAHHTATPLPDGRVLVVGGLFGAFYGAIAQPEVWDPATGRSAPCPGAGPALARQAAAQRR